MLLPSPDFPFPCYLILPYKILIHSLPCLSTYRRVKIHCCTNVTTPAHWVPSVEFSDRFNPYSPRLTSYHCYSHHLFVNRTTLKGRHEQVIRFNLLPQRNAALESIEFSHVTGVTFAITVVTSLLITASLTKHHVLF